MITRLVDQCHPGNSDRCIKPLSFCKFCNHIICHRRDEMERSAYIQPYSNDLNDDCKINLKM